MRQTRRGFTLIEILVVIGIILVLVGLLVAGFRHLNRTAANKETTSELHVCKGLLQEYENHNGLQGVEFFVGTPPVKATDNGAPATPKLFPVYADAASGDTIAKDWESVALTDVSSGSNTDVGSKSPTGSARYAPAITNTLNVMYVLMRIPANQTTVQSIQAKRLMEPIPPATSPNPITQGAVLLDGWGNPIIYVPRAGLHVNIKDPTNGNLVPYVVRSTGTLPITGGQDPAMTGSERPFWASAGQDGDFTAGEDNVYSFQD